MQFSKFILASSVGVLVQAIRFTNPNFNNITLDKPFNITWADAAGPVTLNLLLGGTPAYFKMVGPIASEYSHNHANFNYIARLTERCKAD